MGYHKSRSRSSHTMQRSMSRPASASHNSVLGDAQHCSCSIMTTDKYSLSHATCKDTDAIISDLTEPNFRSKIVPVRLISLVFLSFPSLIMCMTLCCETRGRQLSNGLSSAMRTSVFCSAELRRVLPCLLNLHKAIYFHTTGGHVITLLWSLWNHFNSRTRLNYSIRK